MHAKLWLLWLFRKITFSLNAASFMQMQPSAPVLQLLTPLRRPPSTPRQFACSVHDKVMHMAALANASMSDTQRLNTLLFRDATEVSHSAVHMYGACQAATAHSVLSPLSFQKLRSV